MLANSGVREVVNNVDIVENDSEKYQHEYHSHILNEVRHKSPENKNETNIGLIIQIFI